MKWFRRHETQKEAEADRDEAMNDIDDREAEAERKLHATQREVNEVSRAAVRARVAQRRADLFTRELEQSYRRPPPREAT